MKYFTASIFLIISLFLLPLYAQNESKMGISVCAISQLKIIIYSSPESKPKEIITPKGCRCSFIFKNIELLPTAPMPMSFCQEPDPSDRVKKDK